MRHYLKNHIIRAILFIALVISLRCVSQNNKEYVITKINLIVNYPLLKPPDFELTNLKDTIPIYFFENIILYKLPFTRSFENEEKILSVEKDYAYFIFYRKSKEGAWFNSIADTANGILMSVDSVLKKRGYKTDFGGLIDSLSYADAKNYGDTTLEKYTLKNKNETTFDSVYLYFNKNSNNVEYSFSPKIDSIRGAKLFRIKLLYNEKFSNTYNIVLPFREISFEIQKSNMENSTEMDAFKSLKHALDRFQFH